MKLSILLSADPEEQALALLLFIHSKTSNPLVQKVAAYVAQGPSTSLGPLCPSVSGFEAAVIATSLSAYDESKNATKPNLNLAVSAGAMPLLNFTFNPSNLGKLANSSTPWGRLAPSSTLKFTSAGTGQVSVVASMTFTPAELLPYPTYHGLWVQRVVQLANTGGSVMKAPLAQEVTLIIQVCEGGCWMPHAPPEMASNVPITTEAPYRTWTGTAFFHSDTTANAYQ